LLFYKVVLDNGGVQRLVTLVHSMDSNLRLNAIWALKNIVFSAESQIKDKIMKELGWDQLYTYVKKFFFFFFNLWIFNDNNYIY